MKYFIFAMLMTIFVGTVHAQNYVVCQSTSTNEQQVFEGSCPWGWRFIRYA